MSRRRVNWERVAKVKLPRYARSDTQRILVCWNEYWTAGAVWERREGIWACVVTEPQIEWMKRRSPEKAKLELARLGCEWQWMK